MGKLQVIVGGQFGSEGKGALAAWLARKENRSLLAIRVAGPNAGHTVYDDDGVEFKLQQIPVAAMLPGVGLAIAAGSEIDEAILRYEIDRLEATDHSVKGRLFIDRQATLIDPEHVVRERGGVMVGTGLPGGGTAGVLPLAHGEAGLTKRIGSTGKGVGAARAARIMREAKIYDGDVDVAYMARRHLMTGGTVQVEGTQGFGLGLHAGFYPYCTSSDCRAIDFLSMAGISPWASEVMLTEVWIAIRTHPIRVAGDSGPLFNETTWEAIGQPPEFTTVTKKIRRVGEFNAPLVQRAIKENGGPSSNVRIALMFGDYVAPGVAGHIRLIRRQEGWLREFEDRIGNLISAVGTGPKTVAEVVDR